ncbi:MAG: tetratricopeptide repeat protein [Symploca sp. SIO1C4]|uniref:Tetratricopeptide repeat protein n=1 Tax=Symploca sp. SIO1C4 TaxID=2607765 RepID=A0A6B3N9M5_9CYAN|nr:tetratricopeptide repeat protein [Symploca sp. SIO1C4]
MTNSELDTALSSYQKALSTIKESQTLKIEQVLAVLNARDLLQDALAKSENLSIEDQQELVELDIVLKKQAEKIIKVINLAEYRTSFQPCEQKWWWKLEREVPPHLWDRWDWLWRGVTVGCWTVNLAVLVDIVPRFLTAGTGVVGAVAVAFPSFLTLLQAKSELTETGKKAFEKFLNRLRIPPHYHEEARLVSILLLLGFLLSFRGLFPFFSDWYNQQGLKSYRNRELAGAEEKYLQALKLNPDNFKAHYNLGIIYEDLQEFEKARMSYQFAVKGNLVKAQNNLARLQILAGKSELAIPLLWQGLNKTEAELPLRVRYSLMKNLGWALFKQKQPEQAETILKAAIGLASTPEGLEQIKTRSSSHCLLAQVYQQQKQDSKALEQWQECFNLGSIFNPDEDKWLGLAHQALKKSGDYSCSGNKGES